MRPRPDAQAATPRAVVSVHRLDLPLERSVDEAWALVDEAAFPPITRTVWNANGLRVGVMNGDPQSLAAFVEALPGVAGIQRSHLAPGEYPTPLIAAPRQPEPIKIDLTIPPRAVREEFIRGGRIQLLTHMVARAADGSPGDGIRVEVTPHHHIPQVRLTPPDPQVAMLDGRLFTELTLRAELPPGKTLVIGLYTPPAPPGNAPAPGSAPAPEVIPNDVPGGEPEPESDARISAMPSEAEPLSDEPKPEDAEEPAPPGPPQVPAHLGRALLTGKRYNRAMQMMILISPEMPAGSTRGDASGG